MISDAKPVGVQVVEKILLHKTFSTNLKSHP
jgi:hypothetical protein